MIHFDLEDRYQDELVVGTALSRREGVVYAVVLHVVLLGLVLFAPQLKWFQPSPEELEAQRLEQMRQIAQERENRTFVFVQPKVDMPAKAPPPRAELSDIDRQARSNQPAPQPTNPLPFSRGNSTERTESAEKERARGPETPQPQPRQPEPKPEEQIARNLPPAPNGVVPRMDTGIQPRPSGSLGEALKNLDRYVQNQTFNNPQGGNQDPGSQIQFDTKGVEFGPWIRRFVAQVRRNWFVPQAAMTFKGKVVLQFNIHKSGAITDVTIVEPSTIEAFTRAAYNAILGSNPTQPLPPEYPDEKALFTVTFYYNQEP